METQQGTSVLCLVGHSGTGKSTLAKVLKHKLNDCQIISTASLFLSAFSNEEISSYSNVSTINRAFNDQLECADFINLVAETILWSQKFIIIDSIKSTTELSFLKAKIDRPILIGIHLLPSEREGRIKKRGRTIDPKNDAELRDLLQYEIEMGVDDLLENAHFTINNSGTIEELEQNVMKILELVD